MSAVLILGKTAAGLLAAAAMAFSLVHTAPRLQQSLPLAGAFVQDPAAALQALEGLSVPEEAESTPSAAVQPALPAEAAQGAASFPEGAQPTAAPETADPAAQNDAIPDGCGPVLEQHYSTGQGERYILLDHGSIKNCTSLSAAEIQDAAFAGLPFAIEAHSSEPQVLIMHTHATESYLTESGAYYPLNWSGRTTDPEMNMCAVGRAMADVLNAAGICTLHNETLHDYPSYNGSYDRSRATVQQILAEHPSIRIVLDIHRDAIEKNGSVIAPVNGEGSEKTAQVMLICGCDKGGNLPNFRQNLAFAAAWQNQMEADTPGFTRPVLFDYRFYNQDLTTGSLLMEVGGHGNTLPQAVAAGQKAAVSLAKLLLSN